MEHKFSHQIITGVSFGLTSGVITAIGLIMGLYAATSSKTAVISGIIVMAVADGLADAAGLHTSEEAETEKGKVKHTSKETWRTAIFTFLSVSGFILTFAVPLLLFPIETAVYIDIAWGLMLLILLNFQIAKITNRNPAKLISEHIILALFVIVVSNWIGTTIAKFIR
jgi:VIT1/CCC1 family predicted Fe2+/Mn2+ transporter